MPYLSSSTPLVHDPPVYILEYCPGKAVCLKITHINTLDIVKNERKDEEDLPLQQIKRN